MRYRRFPYPKGGLEIPIIIVVKKHKASPVASNKLKRFILEYYTDPRNIKISRVQSEMVERCSNDDLEKHGHQAYDVEASQQYDAEIAVLEGVICIN